jgi:osmoprotectant transport system ATP-binding protein
VAVIRTQALGKRFGESWAVRDFDLEIESGETVVLIGPSGCGKTTTLRMLNRLIEPSTGKIEVLGQDIRAVDPAMLRRRIGYVIQDVGLFAHYTVRRNVALVPELLGWDRHRIDERVDQLLTLLGLSPAEFRDRYPRQLSGGQRQRVGIARALAADPSLVLLDEPFGALDPITRESVQSEFLALSRQLDKTFVMVTHDIFEAVRLADRIVVLDQGRIVQVATPGELVRRPADVFVEAMLGRHRYQLKLMTCTLTDTFGPFWSDDADARDRERAIDLDAQSSVWDALDLLEQSGSELLRVKSGDAVRTLRRHQLLEAVK